MPKQKTQGGNAFIIILVGIFLFGALMFTFTRSGQKGSGNLTKQQSKIAAQEILNYARLVEGAVDRIRRKGCSESEISFENDALTGYVNPNAPIDKSCHVFEPEGGRISYVSPDKKWLDNNISGPSHGDLVITGNLNIQNIGTTALDLIFYIPYVEDKICNEINNLIGITTTGTDLFGGGTTQFLGSFNAATHPVVGDEEISVSGKSFFCIKRTSNINFFMYAILAR